MADDNELNVAELFEQARKNYEEAVKAGLKLQEESSQWWMDLMSQAASPQDWKEKADEMVADALPMAQKRMEESLRLLEESSRTSLDLMKQAVEAAKSESAPDAQDKLQNMWEGSLEAMRNNAEVVTKFNSEFLETWMQSVTNVTRHQEAQDQN